MATATATHAPTPGSIEPNVLYKLSEIQARSGIGEWGLRTARRNGLRVRYIANRGFVMGQDFIAYFLEKATDSR